MKFLITIEANTQPKLIEALDAVRARLVEGGCFLNVDSSYGIAVLKPADDASEGEFRKQYLAAHPQIPAWTK